MKKKEKDSLFKGILLPLIGLSFLLYFSKPNDQQITQQTDITELNSGTIETNQSINISAVFYKQTADHYIFIDSNNRNNQIRVDGWTIKIIEDLVIGKVYDIKGTYDGFQLIESTISPIKGNSIKECIPIWINELNSVTEINCSNGLPIAVENNIFPRHINKSEGAYIIEYEVIGNSYEILRVKEND